MKNLKMLAIMFSFVILSCCQSVWSHTTSACPKVPFECTQQNGQVKCNLPPGWEFSQSSLHPSPGKYTTFTLGNFRKKEVGSEVACQYNGNKIGPLWLVREDGVQMEGNCWTPVNPNFAKCTNQCKPEECEFLINN